MKKYTCRTFIILMALLILSLALPAAAYASWIDNRTFRVSDGVYCRWSSTDNSLTFYGATWADAKGPIPAPSDALGSWQEYKDHAWKIIIEDGVTEVGYNAFKDFDYVNTLTINSRDLTKIGDYAFYGCGKLTTLNIASEATSLADIGKFAFAYDGFETLTLPRSIKTMGDHSFYNCYKLTEVAANGPLDIPDYGFAECKELKKFTTRISLNTIGDYAFFNDPKLEIFNDGQSKSHDFQIPSRCISIGNGAFSFSSWQSKEGLAIKDIYIDGLANTCEIGDRAFSASVKGKDDKYTYLCRGNVFYMDIGVKSIGAYAMAGCNGAQIGERVEQIGEGAFYGSRFYYDMKYYIPPDYNTYDTKRIYSNIVIPKSVKKIGKKAFYNCVAGDLIFETDDDGSGNLEEIGDHAFARVVGNSGDDADIFAAEGDHVLYFPTSLKTIGNGAFINNYKLKGISFIKYTAALTQIGSQAFAYCDLSDRMDYLPSSLKTIGNKAFYDTAISGKLHLENTALTATGVEAFACESDTEVSQATGGAHKGSTITTVLFPSSLETISDRCFTGADEITAISFPNGCSNLSTIGKEAFYCQYGNGLETLTGLKNNNIKTIAEGAFRNTPLTSFHLTDRIESVEKDAFAGTKLKDLTIPGSLSHVRASFPDTLEKVTIETGVKTIDDEAFGFDRSVNRHYSLYLPIGQQSMGGIKANPMSVTISLPVTIENLSCLDFYYEDGVPKYRNNTRSARPAYEKIIFRGTEDQWKELNGGRSVEEYKEDFKTIYDEKDVPEIECIGNPNGDEGGKCGQYLTYSYDSSARKLVITGYGTMYDYDEAENKSPWSGKNINDLVLDITEGKTFTVGADAFYNVKFAAGTTVDLSKCSAIGKGGFKGSTGLRKVTFPDLMTVISDYAFEGCTSLAEVSVPETTWSHGAYAFKDCTNLKTADFTVHKKKYTDSRDIISNGFFSGCSLLQSVKISDVDGIYVMSNAFEGCSALKSVGSDVTVAGLNITNDAFLDPGAFKGSGIEKISIAGSGSQLYAGAFEGCTALTDVTLAGVTSLPMGAFSGCTNLASLSLPEVTTIKDDVFKDCTSLRNINIPKVTSLKDGAFKGCTSLESVNIPKVTTLGETVFSGCSNLESVDITGVTDIGEAAFYQCTKLSTVNVTQNKLKTIGNYAFYGCSSLPLSDAGTGGSYTYKLYKQDNLQKIGDKAFYKCTGDGFKKINYPGLKSMGEQAFAGCTNLADVTLGGLKTIPSNAFGSCNSLSSVKLTGVESLGKGAFGACPALTSGSFTADDALKTIGDYAFSWCKFDAFTIPSGVTAIGQRAFYKCDSLETVTFTGQEGCKLGSEVFTDCTSLKTVNGSETITSFGTSVFSGCTALEVIDLNPAMEKISGSSFSGSSLKDIRIPGSVRRIDSCAYNHVTPEKVTYSGTIDQWKEIDIDYYKTGSDTGNDCLKAVTIYCSDGMCGYGITDRFSVHYGNELFWSLDNEGTLEIHGAGDMDLRDQDYHLQDAPWEEKKDTIKKVIIGGGEDDNVQSVYNDVFKALPNLESVTLSLSETKGFIGQGAFAQCPKLESVSVNSALRIDDGAFKECTALKDVTISMTYDDYHYEQSIGNEAFMGCTSLENVELAEGLDKIGDKAFNGCTSLKELDIPHSVGSIGAEAFTGCGGEDGLSITDQGSTGVTDYISSLSPEELEKISRTDEVAVKNALLDKGELTIDLSSGAAKLDSGKTALLLDTLPVIAQVTDTEQGKRVDFDPDEPYLEWTWSKADDMLITLAPDGGCSIVPLEWDEYLTQNGNPVNIPVYDWQKYDFVCMDKEYYSNIKVAFPSDLEEVLEKCTISFDAGGGSGEMEQVEVRKYTWYNLPDCGFTATGYTIFDCWDKGEAGEAVYITADTVIKALWRDHAHELEYVKARENSCISDGNLAYYVCGVCGRFFSDSEGKNEISRESVNLPLDKNGHIYDPWVVEKEPTESEPGKKFSQCSLCGDRLEREIPVIGHEHTFKYHDMVSANCVKPGFPAYYECESCQIRYLDKDDESTEIMSERQYLIPIDPDAHEWDEGEETTPRTCLTNGVKTFHCRNNAEHIRIEDEEKTGHKWGKWQVVKLPAAGQDGLETRICENDPDHVEYRPIPAIDPYKETESVNIPTGIAGPDGISISVNVVYSKTVSYNGLKHVADGTKKKTSADVKVEVTSSLSEYAGYTLKFKNNKNAVVKNGKSPQFIVSFKAKPGATKEQKAAVKGVNRLLKARPFSFTIAPANLESIADIQVIKSPKGDKVKKVIVTIGGRELKLTKKDCTATIGSDGKVTIKGIGNFTGTTTR